MSCYYCEENFKDIEEEHNKVQELSKCIDPYCERELCEKLRNG